THIQHGSLANTASAIRSPECGPIRVTPKIATGYSGISEIGTGLWRGDATSPMQVISGSVGRATGDLLLTSGWEPQRFYSLSAQIQRERKAYYDILERTQNERQTKVLTGCWTGLKES